MSERVKIRYYNGRGITTDGWIISVDGKELITLYIPKPIINTIMKEETKIFKFYYNPLGEGFVENSLNVKAQSVTFKISKTRDLRDG